MSLISCPECGRRGVSDSTNACPGCGYNIAMHPPTKCPECGLLNKNGFCSGCDFPIFIFSIKTKNLTSKEKALIKEKSQKVPLKCCKFCGGEIKDTIFSRKELDDSISYIYRAQLCVECFASYSSKEFMSTEQRTHLLHESYERTGKCIYAVSVKG